MSSDEHADKKRVAGDAHDHAHDQHISEDLSDGSEVRGCLLRFVCASKPL